MTHRSSLGTLMGSMLNHPNVKNFVAEARRFSIVGSSGPSTNYLPDSSKRFRDGAHYRYEIASTEGPTCLHAILEEAANRGSFVHRASQGSGVSLLTDSEIDEMVTAANAAGVEVSLFARPTSGWGLSPQSKAPQGAVSAGTVMGEDGLAHALADCLRAAAAGIRSVLISDLGLLHAFSRARQRGVLPADMQAKVSVMIPVANASTARVLEDLGADTINVQTDLPLSVLSEIRQAVDVPLDVYVEAPDTLGGFIRHAEVPELIRIAAPVYVKLGLRNAPDLYPSGTHIDSTAIALSRERVRRVSLVRGILDRSGTDFIVSKPRAEGLAVPVLSLSS